jgi:GNAT superfamily N-acetyltransferase
MTGTEIMIRERKLEDDDAVVAIRNDGNPHIPPITVERYRFQADPALVPEGGINDRFVAERDDRVVGIYFFGGDWSYERPDTYFASIGVARAEWGRGIGGALYRHIMDRAGRLGAKRIYGNVLEGDEHSMGFAERRGYQPDGRVARTSRLTLADASDVGIAEARDSVAKAGIDICTLQEAGLEDAFLRRLHDVQFEIEKDIPGGEDYKDTPFELWKKRLLEWPGQSPEHFWIALDGHRPIGLAALDRTSERTAFNGLTGVAREYRGKGIARALKSRQLAWCRQNGIEHIFTSNDVDNRRMLDINIRLGYKPVPGQIEVVQSL